MTAENRYWNHEACAWVTFRVATIASPEVLDKAVPEQRVDHETAPVEAATAAPDATS